MRRQRAFLALFLFAGGCVSHPEGAVPPSPPVPATAPVTPEAMTTPVVSALRKGTAFLIRTQNPDGSWGSHVPPLVGDKADMGTSVNDWGGQDAWRNAVTALCARALLELPDPSVEAVRSRGRATAYLLENWKTGFGGNTFHSWSLAYTLDYLLGLDGRPEGVPYHDRIRETVPGLIRGLQVIQLHEGGWAYYGDPMMGSSSMSFTTASVLLPLQQAERQGFEVPRAMLEDARRILRSMRLPDGLFMYGNYLKYNTRMPLSPLGGGCRSQAAALALHEGTPGGDLEGLRQALAFFFESRDYLEVARKRMIPHRDAPHQLSGYFYYYGYFHVAESLKHLPEAEARGSWDRIMETMLRTQEPDGSWWDTLCFEYGDKWGTAFAMRVLEGGLKPVGTITLREGTS